MPIEIIFTDKASFKSGLFWRVYVLLISFMCALFEYVAMALPLVHGRIRWTLVYYHWALLNLDTEPMIVTPCILIQYWSASFYYQFVVNSLIFTYPIFVPWTCLTTRLTWESQLKCIALCNINIGLWLVEHFKIN